METKKVGKSVTEINRKAIIEILVFSKSIAKFNETILNFALLPLTTEVNVMQQQFNKEYKSLNFLQ